MKRNAHTRKKKKDFNGVTKLLALHTMHHYKFQKGFATFTLGDKQY